MVPARDADALTRALVELLRDPSGRASMRERNFELVRQRADQENEMRRMAGIYQKMAG
jgi:hypothetical protein